MIRRWKTRLRHDGGFTLPELLIVTIILGVITIPLGNLVISYFTNTNTAVGRVSESHDAQQAAAYFAQDMSNMGVRDANSNAQKSVWNAAPFPSCAPGGDTQRLVASWTDYTWDSVNQVQSTLTYVAAYTTRLFGSETQLHRVLCLGGTQQSDIVLAHDVSAVGTITATCAPVADCGSTTTSVTLTVPIKNASGSGQPYTLTLQGNRRQS